MPAKVLHAVPANASTAFYVGSVAAVSLNSGCHALMSLKQHDCLSQHCTYAPMTMQLTPTPSCACHACTQSKRNRAYTCMQGWLGGQVTPESTRPARPYNLDAVKPSPFR